MKPEECPPVKEDWLFGPEQVEHFLRYRRSIRNYKKKQVEQEVLIKLINAEYYHLLFLIHYSSWLLL
jgi:hypothetical protein